jgi:hypothetical protein
VNSGECRLATRPRLILPPVLFAVDGEVSKGVVLVVVVGGWV